MAMLEACGFHPVIGVKVLIQKALISINSDGKIDMIDMHDLVQEMGHYIVRGEHSNNPLKHSRVWKVDDVKRIFATDRKMELDKIEAIRYENNDTLPSHVDASMTNLRSVDLTNIYGSCLPTYLLTMEIRCLNLTCCKHKQLWEGYKYLPILRYIKIFEMDKLITTPDVTRLPNLERFDIDRCDSLEKIHSSTGRSENLVHLHITECRKLVLIPPITGSKKLETLLIKDIPQLLEKQPDKAEFDVQFSSVKPSLPHNIRHITSHKTLTNLSLRNCKLGDDMSFVVGEIPNLQQLDLAENNFSRLDFSMFNLPRLKYLKVSLCLKLLELWELPSSIAILRADYCHSFKSIGNILDCKWLWKVSLLGTSPVFQILKIMSEGNAIEDHCISLASPPNQLQMDFVDRVVKRGEIFTLQLPPNWYDDSCGFFICIYSNDFYPCYAITLKPEMGKDFQFEDGQESSVAPTPHKKKHTYVGYVSLKMLKRHTPAPWWNLAYNITSFSILVDDVAGDTTFGAKLVLRKSKGHAVRTTNVETDYSEFWDEQYGDRNTFTIQHDSNSSIKILWTPCGYN